MRRLLLPTEEFPIRSSLQLMIEFVEAIEEDEGGEEMVVREQTPSAPSLGVSPLGSWRARERLVDQPLHSLNVKLGHSSCFPSSTE